MRRTRHTRLAGWPYGSLSLETLMSCGRSWRRVPTVPMERRVRKAFRVFRVTPVPTVLMGRKVLPARLVLLVPMGLTAPMASMVGRCR